MPCRDSRDRRPRLPSCRLSGVLSGAFVMWQDTATSKSRCDIAYGDSLSRIGPHRELPRCAGVGDGERPFVEGPTDDGSDEIRLVGIFGSQRADVL